MGSVVLFSSDCKGLCTYACYLIPNDMHVILGSKRDIKSKGPKKAPLIRFNSFI